MGFQAWSPWDIGVFIVSEGHQHGSAVLAAPNYFGLVGFKQASLETDDVGILRIPIFRTLGAIGRMVAQIEVGPRASGGDAAIEGIDFQIVSKEISWDLPFPLVVGGLKPKASFTNGEKGIKYVQVRFFSNVTRRKTFSIRIASAIVQSPLTSFTGTSMALIFSIQNIKGPWIDLANRDMSVTVIPVVRGAGQIGFQQPLQVASEFETVDVVVNRYSGSEGAISARAFTVNDTAVAGVHYTAVTQTLSWPDGDNTPRIVSIPLLGVSSDVKFKVQLDSLQGGIILDPNNEETEVEIHNLSAVPGDLAFELKQIYTAESVIITVKVKRVNGDAGAVSVVFQTNDGSAVAGSDYTAAGGTLNWVDQDSADKTFTVTILAVNLNVFFELELNTPGGGAGILVGFDTAFVNIVNTGAQLAPPPQNELEQQLFDNLVYQSTMQDHAAAYVQQTSLAIFADRLVGGVLGWSGAISSFDGGSDLPPQTDFGALSLKQKYGMSAGAG